LIGNQNSISRPARNRVEVRIAGGEVVPVQQIEYLDIQRETRALPRERPLGTSNRE
jgi:hypothetical protein